MRVKQKIVGRAATHKPSTGRPHPPPPGADAARSPRNAPIAAGADKSKGHADFRIVIWSSPFKASSEMRSESSGRRATASARTDGLRWDRGRGESHEGRNHPAGGLGRAILRGFRPSRCDRRRCGTKRAEGRNLVEAGAACAVRTAVGLDANITPITHLACSFISAEWQDHRSGQSDSR